MLDSNNSLPPLHFMCGLHTADDYIQYLLGHTDGITDNDRLKHECIYIYIKRA